MTHLICSFVSDIVCWTEILNTVASIIFYLIFYAFRSCLRNTFPAQISQRNSRIFSSSSYIILPFIILSTDDKWYGKPSPFKYNSKLFSWQVLSVILIENLYSMRFWASNWESESRKPWNLFLNFLFWGKEYNWENKNLHFIYLDLHHMVQFESS